MELKEIILKIAQSREADILLYSAGITSANADSLILKANKIEIRNKNVILILTTNGGDPAAAYRIVRFLQKTYDKLILYVFGRCKSAGTLIALGAHEIVMTDFGELGPLDIQLEKEDDLLHNSSGLALHQAMIDLKEQAITIFSGAFFEIIGQSDGVITSRTAANIATSLSTGLLSPIAAQIDPLKLGEVQRALNISLKYGERITDNRDAYWKLTTDYPSHDFVIDLKEAKELFGEGIAKDPTDDEKALSNLIFGNVRNQKNFIDCLVPTMFNKETTNESDEPGGEANQESGTEHERDNPEDLSGEPSSPSAEA